MVCSLGMERERKNRASPPWLYSSQHSVPIMWMERTQNLHFQNCILAPGSWRKPVWFRSGMGRVVCIGISLAGALGLEHTQLWVTDACSPVLMWPACETIGTHNATQRSTPLIVWEITPSWRNSFLKGWNTFLNRRSFSRGVEPRKRCLMMLDWVPGTVSSSVSDLGTFNWKQKKKKNATLNLRFISAKFYAVHTAESLGTQAIG